MDKTARFRTALHNGEARQELPMRWVWDDVRDAARLLRHAPLFTTTAVPSLAVTIAGDAAIFSPVDALFLWTVTGLAQLERLVEMPGWHWHWPS